MKNRMWTVGYEINGVEYKVNIPDGSNAGYSGHDVDRFNQHVVDNHSEEKHVEITFSIPVDHPLASFFGR